ncbi:hypothetical protein SDC9_04198 [bioreactor metagenome]|uniref:Spore coat protein n=1 Tax=bioreactor metagenome TaxID=1076179 RepID=A0A644SVI0_9ZZZZ|nr:hypothetical protein [Negativicutes bacterium]
MNLTTRELLYLEDLTKLFESVDKNCSRGIQTSNDPQVKSLLQGLSQDHKQWMQSISSIVTSNGNLQ